MAHEKLDALDMATDSAMPVFKKLAGEAVVPGFFSVFIPTYIQGGWPGIEWFALGFFLALAWIMLGRTDYQHALKQHYAESILRYDHDGYYGHPAKTSFWILYTINASLAFTSTVITGVIALAIGVVTAKYLPPMF